jgi:uncharacterized SAM-binding protein YcdF (DUF218 family)
LAKDRSIEKIVIVSDPLHLARAREMAQDLGFEVAVSAADVTQDEDTERSNLLRETFVLTYYRIFKEG